MALNINESFKVAAPIARVWDFMLTPQNVVDCMPGASLTEVVDPRRFIGAVKIRVGAVTAQYQGSITYREIDRSNYTMELLAEGNERGGGGVKGTITTRLVELPDNNGTEVRCSAGVDLTGRIAQIGRGMIEGVSAQIIKKYVGNVRASLEAAAEPAVAGGSGSTATPLPAQPRRENSINVFAVVFRVWWDGLRNLFRRLVRL